MKMLKSFILILSIIFSSHFAFAQPEMADGMRAEGKIYVVVAIILIVLAGIFVYLFMVDRKLKKLEDLFREKR